jgi:hypothetical protein
MSTKSLQDALAAYDCARGDSERTTKTAALAEAVRIFVAPSGRACPRCTLINTDAKANVCDACAFPLESQKAEVGKKRPRIDASLSPARVAHAQPKPSAPMAKRELLYWHACPCLLCGMIPPKAEEEIACEDCSIFLPDLCKEERQRKAVSQRRGRRPTAPDFAPRRWKFMPPSMA